MKRILLFVGMFCCCCFVSAQVTISPGVINFFTVIKGAPDSIFVTFTNDTDEDLVVQDVDFYHSDAFYVKDSVFTVNHGGGTHGIWVFCNPRHNVRYADWLMVRSSSHCEVPHAFTFAFAKYDDPYYDPTQNLYNEDLKAALHTLISTSTVALTYNNARDKLFMNIDNQLVNGQGASQNTLECVYTGTIAAGYTDRQDAQNNYNMNTEHTMPQSLFSSAIPMYSDMHHLFVATSASNSERGNNPFGVVANPSWQQGGSKSNGNIFEPRDQHKGKAARALLYFKTRYQDYQGFICGMEGILRQWNADFAPDSTEIRRNDQIEVFQFNRNPYSDHPEFMERIADFCSVNTGDSSAMAWWVTDTLDFGYILGYDTLDGYFAIVNQGEHPLVLSNLAINDTMFSILGSPLLSIPRDSVRLIPIRYYPHPPIGLSEAVLTFNTNDPNHANVAVQLRGIGFVIGTPESAGSFPIQIWPNPVQDKVHISINAGFHTPVTGQVLGLAGNTLREFTVPSGTGEFGLDVAGLPNGTYLLRLMTSRGGVATKMITVSR